MIKALYELMHTLLLQYGFLNFRCWHDDLHPVFRYVDTLLVLCLGGGGGGRK